MARTKSTTNKEKKVRNKKTIKKENEVVVQSTQEEQEQSEVMGIDEINSILENVEKQTEEPKEEQQKQEEPKKKERVMIGITTAETVAHECMQSIYDLDVPENVECVLRIIHSYNVADGRNQLATMMINEGFDYLFFVDNDVILPKNALVDLYNMQWYFSVGTYPRKEERTINNPDPFTTLYYHHDRNKEVYCPFFLPFHELKEGYITPVDCCGLGCALIKKDLFLSIEQPWFFFAHEGNPQKGSTDEYCIGEDMYFCRKVIRAGVQIWAHGSVICGHLGKYVYHFPKRG